MRNREMRAGVSERLREHSGPLMWRDVIRLGQMHARSV